MNDDYQLFRDAGFDEVSVRKAAYIRSLAPKHPKIEAKKSLLQKLRQWIAQSIRGCDD